jgi:maltose alpha-D-glucosyltransferase / alpha-amylase
MKVLIDFVLNHTSDVWADDDSAYPSAPIIFPYVETSNWAFDPVRKQYFRHRFNRHQPDLNFENPAVRAAVLDALRFWLDLGVDGFRLDAVPYLYAREGTNCAHLPETHEFLRELRHHLDAEYPDRVLLAEANGLPDEVAAYHGRGDECHMAFHFPLMPRIFSALRREDRAPIAQVIEQTPPTPTGCQWGIFLRNHDELTLETVDPDERTYLWSEYVADPRMRANLGIRRRLAPLLDHMDRTRLATALLLSLPGSPVLYYGDEIGMGDNIWLPDRDGVRTPMQWTGDRNGGFSHAEPSRLLMPINIEWIRSTATRHST